MRRFPGHLANDTHTIRSSTPRRSAKMLCRRPSSRSAVSPSSPFPGRGPSPLNWCATRTGLYRLRSGASPRRCATRHPLDARRSRAVDRRHGAALADRICWIPPPAEAAVPPAHTGRSQSRVSSWVAPHACGPDDERNPAPFLVNSFFLPFYVGVPMPRIGSFPSSPGLSVFAQVVVHFSHLTSLLSLSSSSSLGLSLSFLHQSSMLSCHAVLIVPSHFPYNQGLIPSSVQLRYFPSNADSIMANMLTAPCPRNPHIP